MPLTFEKQIDQHSRLAVWEITEDSSFFIDKLDLTEYDQAAIDEIKFEHRLNQWLSSRYLVKYLVDKKETLHLSKDEFEKPVLLNVDLELSISHSDKYAAAIVSNQDVGIDVESYRDKIVRLAPKFMFESQIEEVKEEHKIQMLTAYWSMKESLFKLYARGNVDFKTELDIPLFDWSESGEVPATIKKDGGISTLLNYTNFNGHVLTWVIGTLNSK